MCFLPRAIKLIYGDEDTDTEIGREGLGSALVGGGRDFFYCRSIEFFFRRRSSAKKAKALPHELHKNRLFHRGSKCSLTRPILS